MRKGGGTMYYIGIDLGTSACKLLLVAEDGSILNTVTKEYALSFPHPGWSEQRAEDWWDAVVTGVPGLLRGFDANQVAGIGSGGQMHGLVALDAADNVIRPAILWNDGRTFKEVEYLNNTIGKDRLSALTANIAFAGFTAPKILWMRENEPENFKKLAKIMLPKDYLTYKLTGVHTCDYSDASGMLLLDVQHKCWSKEMLDICGVSESQMPKLFESFEVVGTLTKEAAKTLGLPESVKVVAGAGDNAAAAVGTGTVGAGGCNISLGTSGTIFISSDKFGVDPNNALHAFAHADGGYHLMGCMLSAASCNKWLCEEILKTSDFAGEQADITDEKLGENHVYFLPYLMGERSPINDPKAKGSFQNLSLFYKRSDLVKAVIEGICFSLYDIYSVMKEDGVNAKEARVIGGGSKNDKIVQMLSDIFGIPMKTISTSDGGALGAIILAMVGDGRYASVYQASESLVRDKKTFEPDPNKHVCYEAKFQAYKEAYRKTKN